MTASQTCSFTRTVLLITYASGSNWDIYTLVYGFFTTIDTAVTRSNRPVVFLHISQISEGNPCAKDSFLKKLQFYRVYFNTKEISEQMVYL